MPAELISPEGYASDRCLWYVAACSGVVNARSMYLAFSGTQVMAGCYIPEMMRGDSPPGNSSCIKTLATPMSYVASSSVASSGPNVTLCRVCLTLQIGCTLL